ncbi:autotransporter assembly complex protein TamA [Pseudoalteromonas sp. SMS1]|uniref:autotransporter assembly complex protein TamA n=1 Tax=Pseudoalteromonas sp. SMS1 TaxID=2908894 RepID=UPI001F15B61E|nr:autotransporter assembly complex family protein [Pseudoalteromonas sp. SMS1]MCF2860330.1 autotransporter assembly complex protein TamA [Pseudoalteromonas sp. SMS1]
MPQIIYFLIFICISLRPALAGAEQVIEEVNVESKVQTAIDNVTQYLSKYQGVVYTHSRKKAIDEDIRSALQAIGYYEYESTVQYELDTQTLQVTLSLQAPLHWQSVEVRIVGEGEEDTALQAIIGSIALKKSTVVRHDVYGAAKAELESALLERGYFDYVWQQRRLEVAPKAGTAQAVLVIDSGRRYRFGQLQLTGDSQAQKFIKKLVPFSQNTPYQAKLLSDYSLTLSATPYFANVKVYPLLKSRKAYQVPIRVDVIDKPAHSFEVGGGYSTDLGAKFRGKWSKPWVSEDGHSFVSDLNLSQRQQDVTAAYTIPVNDPNSDIYRILGGYQLQDELTEGVNSKSWNIQLQRQWLLESNWVRTAFLKREHEKSEQLGLKLDTEMLIPGISFAKKQSKGGMTPYWGSEQLVTLEAAHDSVISSTSLLKVHWKQAWLRQYKMRHLFMLRSELGVMVTSELDKTPLNLRFFAGGDQSIRGFAFQSISPRGQAGQLTGGKYLVTASSEYNYQFLPNWRAAVFVDIGTATNDFSEKWSLGAGFGFRYLTPVGPIRVDHAWGLSKPSRSTRLSIVIGPEI